MILEVIDAIAKCLNSKSRLLYIYYHKQHAIDTKILLIGALVEKPL